MDEWERVDKRRVVGCHLVVCRSRNHKHKHAHVDTHKEGSRGWQVGGWRGQTTGAWVCGTVRLWVHIHIPSPIPIPIPNHIPNHIPIQCTHARITCSTVRTSALQCASTRAFTSAASALSTARVASRSVSRST